MRILKFLLYSTLLLLTFYNIFLSSSLARSGELNFFNDVARDFLLLSELDEKKIVLIGPRSSTNGLFHGPLWTYINYPAFVLGNGNPVTVAWFWIFLEVIFLLSSFFIVKKLFGTFPALIYILFVSIRIVPHLNGIFEPEAAFFFTPAFFFTIFMYIKTKKNLYLVFHLISLAILIQLSVGIGLQFLLLSLFLIIWFIWENRLWKDLFSFFVIPVFLSNFLIFDIRHNFRMTQALLSTGGSFKFFVTLRSWTENRINNGISLQLWEDSSITFFTWVVFILVMFFTIIEIKNKSKQKDIYLLSLFYYFGYMASSFFNKGILLFHYIYLLVPFTALWLISFLSGKYRILFLPLVGIVFFLNFNNVTSTVNAQVDSLGKYPNSWRGLSSVTSEITEREKGKEFGYFVFAPDALAYQPRYAMIYNFKNAGALAFEYTKKPVTYIIAAPPPPNDPYMTHVWWRKNSVKISSEPIKTKKFPNGFTIEKFNLSKAEQNIPHDKTIELGIHFR